MILNVKSTVKGVEEKHPKIICILLHVNVLDYIFQITLINNKHNFNNYKN